MIYGFSLMQLHAVSHFAVELIIRWSCLYRSMGTIDVDVLTGTTNSNALDHEQMRLLDPKGLEAGRLSRDAHAPLDMATLRGEAFVGVFGQVQLPFEQFRSFRRVGSVDKVATAATHVHVPLV